MITPGAASGWLGVTIWTFLIVVPFGGIPVACAVAVLKYRLYEIDRLISRTVSYAIVTGLLIGVYGGLVMLATRVLPRRGAGRPDLDRAPGPGAGAPVALAGPDGR